MADEGEMELDRKLPGLADLHLHQWAEHAHGGRWYHGEAEGEQVVHDECQVLTADGKLRERKTHGQMVGQRSAFLPKLGTKWGFRDERSDDVRWRHPAEGTSHFGQPH